MVAVINHDFRPPSAYYTFVLMQGLIKYRFSSFSKSWMGDVRRRVFRNRSGTDLHQCFTQCSSHLTRVNRAPGHVYRWLRWAYFWCSAAFPACTYRRRKILICPKPFPTIIRENLRSFFAASLSTEQPQRDLWPDNLTFAASFPKLGDILLSNNIQLIISRFTALLCNEYRRV